MLDRLLLGCLRLGGLLLGSAGALAAPAPTAPTAPCDTLQVAYYEHGALYYRDAHGLWAGIDKDIVEELARRTGCRFVAKLDSRVRIWANLQNGTLDMTVSGIATPEREAYAHFIPYLSGHNFVVLRPEAAARVHSLADFIAATDYKVAVIKSFKHGPVYDAWLAQLRAQGRVYETADYQALLRLFKLGRVDAVLALGVSWTDIARQNQMAGQYRLMDWAPRDRIVAGLVVSRRVAPALVAQLRRTLQAMRRDGTLKTIFERHVGPELAAVMVNY